MINQEDNCRIRIVYLVLLKWPLFHRSIQLTSHNMVNDMDDAIAGVDVSVQYLRCAY